MHLKAWRTDAAYAFVKSLRDYEPISSAGSDTMLEAITLSNVAIQWHKYI